MSVKETAEERDRRLRTEAHVFNIAKILGGCCEPGIGFALFMFEMSSTPGDGGSFAYASNGQRSDVAKALRELLDRWDKGIG